jgi:hypothetical protein
MSPPSQDSSDVSAVDWTIRSPCYQSYRLVGIPRAWPLRTILTPDPRYNFVAMRDERSGYQGE